MGGYGRGVVCYRLLLDRHGIAATAILVCDDDVCELACVESPWLSRCGRYSVWRGNGRQGRRWVTDRVFCWRCTVVAMCMPSIYMQKWRDVTHCDCGAMRVPVLLCDAVVRVVVWSVRFQ